MNADILKSLIRTVPDWPKPGIQFYDVCSIIENPDAFAWTVQSFVTLCQSLGIEAIVSPDARGFLWGSPVALQCGIPLYLARKPNKLPGETVSQSYTYEYASATIEMQSAAPIQNKRVLILDDVLATGGTACAIASLLQSHFQLAPAQIHFATVINLPFLDGENLLSQAGVKVHSLISFSHE